MSARRGRTLVARVLACPEANFLLFGFLVHYPWEFLQVPLFEGLAHVPHWEAVKFCSAAALGDAGLTVLAYWLAATTEGRRWILKPSRRAVTVYLAAGLLATVFLEWLNAEVLGRWEYAEAMPTLPLVGTGLSPVVQWLLLPLVVLFVVRRQLWGSGRCQQGPGGPRPSLRGGEAEPWTGRRPGRPPTSRPHQQPPSRAYATTPGPSSGCPVQSGDSV